MQSCARSKKRRPNRAVNTDAHRRGFARAVVAGYLDRYAPTVMAPATFNFRELHTASRLAGVASPASRRGGSRTMPDLVALCRCHHSSRSATVRCARGLCRRASCVRTRGRGAQGGVSSSRCAWDPRRVIGRSRARRPLVAVVLMGCTLGPNHALNTDAHRRGFASAAVAG